MKAKRTKKTAAVESARVGKDEMNLAEFPITILANRAPEGVKTLRYQDQHGQLVVTGSDALGLPTAIDADVVVALIELTKKRNNFTEQTVNFSRYELIRLMGWANVGSSYDRVEESLNRWAGVLLIYDGCWWDNRAKAYVSKTFHIIESILIAEGKTKMFKEGRQESLPLSSFTWSKDFMQSCQDNNLKDLDTNLYFSLKYPTSKQLFRFLDKRFYRYPRLEFDLEEIAFERVGLSRSYSGKVGKIKEKLCDSIAELETKGFLKPLSREERYLKTHDGWKIQLVDGRNDAPALPPAPSVSEAEPEPPPLVADLVQRGVAKKTALELVRDFPAEKIQLQIELCDYRLAGKKADKIDDPAAYLVSAIKSESGYTAPKGFTSRAEREQKAEKAKAKNDHDTEMSRRKLVEAGWEKKITAYLQTMTPDARAEFQADALARADAASREAYEQATVASVKKMIVGELVRRRIRQILNLPPEQA